MVVVVVVSVVVLVVVVVFRRRFVNYLSPITDYVAYVRLLSFLAGGGGGWHARSHLARAIHGPPYLVDRPTPPDRTPPIFLPD